MDATTSTRKGRRPVELAKFLLFALVMIGARPRQAESAAVVDNDKQQLLMDSKELSAMVYGGCDDGRVLNCRTLPLFNYTDLTPPPVGADAADDILQDDNCPSVQPPHWPSLPMCGINDYGDSDNDGGHDPPPAAVTIADATDYRYIILISLSLSLLMLYTDRFYLYFLLLLTLLLSFIAVAIVIAVLYCLLVILLMSFVVVIFILVVFTGFYYRRWDANRYKNLERHLRCVDVFTKRCMTVDQRKAFYLLYKVPTLDMQELCTEGGPYREEYLKHAACLRTVHSEYMQCGRRHQKELASLMAEHDQHHRASVDASLLTADSSPPFAEAEQITQNLGHLCGSFRGHLNCVHGIVRATCGEQTEAFASQFLSQMASSLLHVCDKYGNLGDGDVSRSPSSNSVAPTYGTGTRAEVLTVTAAMAFLAAVSRRR